MNCINLLLVVSQGKGDNSVCIRLQKTQHLGKVRRARSSQVVLFQGPLLIPLKAKVNSQQLKSGQEHVLSRLCGGSELSLAELLNLRCFKKVSEFT